MGPTARTAAAGRSRTGLTGVGSFNPLIAVGCEKSIAAADNQPLAAGNQGVQSIP